VGQVQQHDEAGGPLDQGADRGVRDGRAHDQVAFPVTGHCPVLDVCRTFADHHHAREPFPALVGLAVGFAQCPSGAQVLGQLPLQPTAALDV